MARRATGRRWRPARRARVSLERVAIAVDAAEPSYIQYGARDLAGYLTTLGGRPVPVRARPRRRRPARSSSRSATRMAAAYGGVALDGLGAEGFLPRDPTRGKGRWCSSPADAARHQRRLATLLPLIKADRRAPYFDGPLDRRETPSIAVRGIHLNGWPLKYPYAFRSWKEEDWKRFIDIAWAQRINLFYLWPFMEIIPVPHVRGRRSLSAGSQTRRGLRAEPARHGSLDHAVGEPHRRFRLRHPRSALSHLLGDGECQKDMNPADPEQFANILKSLRSLLQDREQRRRLLLYRFRSRGLAA